MILYNSLREDGALGEVEQQDLYKYGDGFVNESGYKEDGKAYLNRHYKDGTIEIYRWPAKDVTDPNQLEQLKAYLPTSTQLGWKPRVWPTDEQEKAIKPR